MSRIIDSIRKRGFRGTFLKAILKILQIDNQQEEIDTLFYFLNSYVDITKIPPSDDEELRIMQKGMLVLLRIFDRLCEREGLTYWLDYGTLLGAIRHNGFIPWDDDLDVAMPREDYNKVIPLFQEEMEKYGIVVRHGGYYDNRGPMARLAFAYKTLETGIWLDIFPIDDCDSPLDFEKTKDLLVDDIKKYRKYYMPIENKKDPAIILRNKEKIFANVNGGNNKIIFHGPEFNAPYYIILPEHDIYPVKKHNFEGFQFSVPANAELYLQCSFGDYMSFPKRGVEHHNDPNGMSSKTRAKRHGVNMEETISYLETVLESI